MNLPVDLRPIRPDDLPELRAGFRRLSPDTRFQRFHAAVEDLSPAQWTYLTHVDGHDHVAFVACVREPFGDLPPGAIVGVARFIRSTEDPTSAEIAFVVWDDVQGRGVGAALRDALVREARAHGVTTFYAHVLPGNCAIRRLLEGGELVFVREDEGIVHVSIEPARTSGRRTSYGAGAATSAHLSG